jgi:ankyrin repeat protein
VDYNGRNPLQYAIIYGQEESTRLLLEKQPSLVNNPNETDGTWSPLHLAVYKGQCKIAQLLLEKGAHVSIPVIVLSKFFIWIIESLCLKSE